MSTVRRVAPLGFGLAGVLASVAAADPVVNIGMGGASIPLFTTTPPDVVRTSAPAILDAAGGYRYTFNPSVQGTGLMALIIPSATPLGDVIVNVGEAPGMYRITYGAMRNPSGTRPARVYAETVAATVSGSDIRLTLALDVRADGVAEAAIRNIVKPSLVGLNITSGGATLEAWTPPAAVASEWHFGGDLRSVKETGLAPGSGPSRLRYLDDPAFGAVLGGTMTLPSYPNPPLPTGVTAAQSAFGTTSSFGISAINGSDAEVYRVSPPRNLSDPGNPDLRRGIGLALWPNTRDFWPDDKLASWTMIMDIYIPAESWTAEFPVAIFDDNHNNAESADAFIRQEGGQGSIGIRQTNTGAYLGSTLIGPGRWMRVAIAVEAYRTGQSRVFVDGVLLGTNGNAGWLYNSVKSTDPRYPDLLSTQPVGTPVPMADWNAWGQFPSPWSLLPNPAEPGNLGRATPLGSTVCLFADLQGRGETFYIANLLFADEAMTDAAIAALGGADARGIVYLEGDDACPADFNGDGNVDPDDLGDFINCYFGVPPCDGADFNDDGNVDPDDLGDFINIYFAGC
ncbi:MAG: hypothetical protein AB7K52_14680 [Phycisphaerales bacterium]